MKALARVTPSAPATPTLGRRAIIAPPTCHSLYGSPVDPRLVEAFDKETVAFRKGAALMTPPVEPVEIPFEEGTTFPAYFCRVDDSGRPRPTLVCTNGYDSTINEMYVTFAGALSRGYNLLLFDGPGQGRPLIKQGIVVRPDWENRSEERRVGKECRSRWSPYH